MIVGGCNKIRLIIGFVVILALMLHTRGYRNLTLFHVSSWLPSDEEGIKSILRSIDYLADVLVENDDPLIINGETIRLQIKFANGFRNETYTKELYNEALKDPSISFFLSPAISNYADSIISLMNDNKRLMLSTSNRFNIQSADHSCCLSVGLSSASVFLSSLPSLRVVGAQTITIITTEGENGITARCTSDIFKEELRLQGFTVKSQHTLLGNSFVPRNSLLRVSRGYSLKYIKNSLTGQRR
mmetsp:Transcript_12566/g.13980  ORF Transcript_12566/g.13980 Transcript_12566/m.13980 type:complete len:243 (+) Transcript_12566:96-824(+)